MTKTKTKIGNRRKFALAWILIGISVLYGLIFSGLFATGFFDSRFFAQIDNTEPSIIPLDVAKIVSEGGAEGGDLAEGVADFLSEGSTDLEEGSGVEDGDESIGEAGVADEGEAGEGDGEVLQEDEALSEDELVDGGFEESVVDEGLDLEVKKEKVKEFYGCYIEAEQCYEDSGICESDLYQCSCSEFSDTCFYNARVCDPLFGECRNVETPCVCEEKMNVLECTTSREVCEIVPMVCERQEFDCVYDELVREFFRTEEVCDFETGVCEEVIKKCDCPLDAVICSVEVEICVNEHEVCKVVDEKCACDLYSGECLSVDYKCDELTGFCELIEEPCMCEDLPPARECKKDVQICENVEWVCDRESFLCEFDERRNACFAVRVVCDESTGVCVNEEFECVCEPDNQFVCTEVLESCYFDYSNCVKDEQICYCDYSTGECYYPPVEICDPITGFCEEFAKPCICEPDIALKECRGEREICAPAEQVCIEEKVLCEFDEEDQTFFRYERICDDESGDCRSIKLSCGCDADSEECFEVLKTCSLVQGECEIQEVSCVCDETTGECFESQEVCDEFGENCEIKKEACMCQDLDVKPVCNEVVEECEPVVCEIEVYECRFNSDEGVFERVIEKCDEKTGECREYRIVCNCPEGAKECSEKIETCSEPECVQKIYECECDEERNACFRQVMICDEFGDNCRLEEAECACVLPEWEEKPDLDSLCDPDDYACLEAEMLSKLFGIEEETEEELIMYCPFYIDECEKEYLRCSNVVDLCNEKINICGDKMAYCEDKITDCKAVTNFCEVRQDVVCEEGDEECLLMNERCRGQIEECRGELKVCRDESELCNEAFDTCKVDSLECKNNLDICSDKMRDCNALLEDLPELDEFRDFFFEEGKFGGTTEETYRIKHYAKKELLKEKRLKELKIRNTKRRTDFLMDKYVEGNFDGNFWYVNEGVYYFAHSILGFEEGLEYEPDGFRILDRDFGYIEPVKLLFVNLIFSHAIEYADLTLDSFAIENYEGDVFMPKVVFVSDMEVITVYEYEKKFEPHLVRVLNLPKRGMGGLGALSGYFSFNKEYDAYMEKTSLIRNTYEAYVDEDIEFRTGGISFGAVSSGADTDATIAVNFEVSEKMNDECVLLVFGNDLKISDGDDVISLSGLNLLSASSGEVPLDDVVIKDLESEKEKRFLGFVYLGDLEKVGDTYSFYLNLFVPAGKTKGRYDSVLSVEPYCKKGE